MKLPDEELQNQIESHSREPITDGNSYKRIFSALTIEPGFHLPLNFADNVLLQIEKKESKATTREFYWLAAGVMLLLVAAVVGVILSGFKPGFGVFKFLDSYSGLIVFGVIFLLLIQWLDKRLIKTPSV